MVKVIVTASEIPNGGSFRSSIICSQIQGGGKVELQLCTQEIWSVFVIIIY